MIATRRTTLLVSSFFVLRTSGTISTCAALSSVNMSTTTTGSKAAAPITFVTGNAKKLEEVQQILGSDLPIVNQKIDLPELQGTPMDIVTEKCRIAAAQVTTTACFVEDTCLCFNALNGMPGPYIKWFLESCGHDGLNKMLVGFTDKTAYAQTIIAYSDDDNEIHVFDGRTNGTIVSPRGVLDFGWDPIFQPVDTTQTYAEMDKTMKHTISHRGKAFAKFKDYLLTKNE